ncbi:MAG: hypothetical protein WD851_20245 [Pirellulales bacterium]
MNANRKPELIFAGEFDEFEEAICRLADEGFFESMRPVTQDADAVIARQGMSHA